MDFQSMEPLGEIPDDALGFSGVIQLPSIAQRSAQTGDVLLRAPLGDCGGLPQQTPSTHMSYAVLAVGADREELRGLGDLGSLQRSARQFLHDQAEVWR
jgi:hypothetical protein